MTTVETVTDRLHFKPPFLLKIDDEEHLIEERAELVNVREHIRIDDELGGLESVHIEGTPFQGTVTLLINNRVVAVAGYRRKGPPVCHIIKNPDDTCTIQFIKEHSIINLPA